MTSVEILALNRRTHRSQRTASVMIWPDTVPGYFV
jgi:hypothetical protein